MPEENRGPWSKKFENRWPRPCNVRPAAPAVDGRACRRGPRHSTV